VPVGGTTSQVLTKTSATDYATAWQTPAAGGGAFVDEAGDTMTGALVIAAASLSLPGAVTAAAARLYGGTPTQPTTQSGGPFELGVRFSTAQSGALSAVRWYRRTAGQPAPVSVRLWDTTDPAAPVWTTASLAAFADTAVGWKEQVLPSTGRPFLSGGRDYVLSLSHASGAYTVLTYTPLPEAPLAFVGHVYANATGTYPTLTGSAAYLSPVLEWLGGSLPAAGSGAVRLPNAGRRFVRRLGR
jgi:hypothetical protein